MKRLLAMAALFLAALSLVVVIGASLSTSGHSSIHRDAQQSSAPRQKTTTVTHTRCPYEIYVASTHQCVAAARLGNWYGIRPAGIAFSANGVHNILWTSWTATHAVGYGASDISSCNPDCADGSIKAVKAVVILTDPVDGEFQTLIWKYGGQTLTFHYPNMGEGW